MTTYDYTLTLAGRLPPEEVDPHVPFGNAANFAAGRLSYFLGAHGPAVVLDTACSSSLVTVHLACQSLRRRESDQALVAGVNLMLSPENSVATSRWGMLAPDGRCKTFDASADGYVRSEGCGVVVLKRLSDAVRDGDSVLAVVRGSAVNQDGPSSGQTVPSGPAQQAVVRSALAAARLEPSDIDYIEAHGTGTALGDPIELGALHQVFGERHGSAPLVLGSVKTNLGHLESAAGIAGFIKTVLTVQHGYIPQHLHFTELTPNAVEGASKFTIAADGMDWPAVGRARRAGVSSFGVSGTNAHVVIEQAPAAEPVAPQPEPVITTLVVSGKSPARIASTAQTLADWMIGEGAAVSLTDVAHTLNHHRTHHKTFATVSARDRAHAVAGLQALAAGQSAIGLVGPHEGLCKPGTVFVYSGQGSQWAGMGRQLLADEPAFAAAVDELEPLFVEHVRYSLQQVLTEGQRVTGDARVQPVLMGLQLALTALWRSYGVEPDAVIGHSMGEVTAAVVAGALTPGEGLRVIGTRSRLMSQLAGQGAVALLEMDADAAEKLLADYPEVSLAGFLSPRQTVVAGAVAQVDAAIGAVSAQERFARRVNMEVASHTALMDPILPELRSALADLTPKPPTIPFISTVADAAETPALDADYWVANVRQPVRLHQAISTAAEQHATFIEISPHPTLTHAVTETLESVHHHSVGTLSRKGDDTVSFHTNLNSTHVDASAHAAASARAASGSAERAVAPHPTLDQRRGIREDRRVCAAARHAARSAHSGRRDTADASVAGASDARRPSRIPVRTTTTVSRSSRYRFCCRHFRRPRPSATDRRCPTSASSTRSSSTSRASFRWSPTGRPSPCRRAPVVPPSTGSGTSPLASLASSDDHPAAPAVRRSARCRRRVRRRLGDLAVADLGQRRSSVRMVDRLLPVDGRRVARRRRADPGLVSCVARRRHSRRPTAGQRESAADGAGRGRRRPVRRRTRRPARPRRGASARRQRRRAHRRHRGDGAGRQHVRRRARTSLRGGGFERGGRPQRRSRGDGARDRLAALLAGRGRRRTRLPARARVAVLGENDIAGTLRDGLSHAGYTSAAVAEARYVLYVAESRSGEADVDGAVRLSMEVVDLVGRLAERDESHPVTLWIITRGVREGSSDAAVAPEPDVGNRRGHPGRAAAIVGRPGRPAGRRRHR